MWCPVERLGVPVQWASGGEAAMVPFLALTRYTEPAQHVLAMAEQQATQTATVPSAWDSVPSGLDAALNTVR